LGASGRTGVLDVIVDHARLVHPPREITGRDRKRRGLLAVVPVTGGALLLASFAVLGSPPFGLFLSELIIVRAGFASASPVFPLLLLALLGLAFVAFARTTAGMVTGSPPAQLASASRRHDHRAARIDGEFPHDQLDGEHRALARPARICPWDVAVT
jgi:hypothetical protein